MKVYSPEERRVLAEAAEGQMRRWTLQCEIDDRVLHEKEKAADLAERLGPYITISRESGAGGGEIGALLGKRLGWQILGREFVDFIAEEYQLPHGMLHFVDETTANWFHDVFGYWFDSRTVSHEKFVRRLGDVVLLAAQDGNVVFIGRGAQCFLPRENGLAVRIVASDQYRLDRVMRLRKLAKSEAQRFIETTDRGRRDFVERYFRQDVADPHLYDVVLNVDRIGVEGAVEHVLDMYRRRFGSVAEAASVSTRIS